MRGMNAERKKNSIVNANVEERDDDDNDNERLYRELFI